MPVLVGVLVAVVVGDVVTVADGEVVGDVVGDVVNDVVAVVVGEVVGVAVAVVDVVAVEVGDVVVVAVLDGVVVSVVVTVDDLCSRSTCWQRSPENSEVKSESSSSTSKSSIWNRYSSSGLLDTVCKKPSYSSCTNWGCPANLTPTTNTATPRAFRASAAAIASDSWLARPSVTRITTCGTSTRGAASKSCSATRNPRSVRVLPPVCSIESASASNASPDSYVVNVPNVSTSSANLTSAILASCPAGA